MGQLEFTEQVTGERRAAQRENCEDLQRVPIEYSADQHKHMRKQLPGLKEGPPRKIKGNYARHSHSARNNTCFSPAEKSPDSQGTGFSAQESLASIGA